MKDKTYPEREDVQGHPSEDRTDRYPTDRELRDHGFKIHSRKGDREPEWERHGLIMKQSSAIEAVVRERSIKK